MAAAPNAACAKGIFYFITDSIENAQKHINQPHNAFIHLCSCMWSILYGNVLEYWKENSVNRFVVGFGKTQLKDEVLDFTSAIAKFEWKESAICNLLHE